MSRGTPVLSRTGKDRKPWTGTHAQSKKVEMNPNETKQHTVEPMVTTKVPKAHCGTGQKDNIDPPHVLGARHRVGEAAR